jgi:hypothetical protein
MNFKTVIGICVLLLVIVAASQSKPPAPIKTALPMSALTQLEDLCDGTDLACLTQAERLRQQAQEDKARAAKELTAVEDCANGMLIIDRSLGVLAAFDICKDPNHSFEAWIAHNRAERLRRAVPVEIIR